MQFKCRQNIELGNTKDKMKPFFSTKRQYWIQCFISAIYTVKCDKRNVLFCRLDLS